MSYSRKNTLRKNERLSERKAIEILFNKGKSIIESPVRLLWIIHPSPAKPQLKAAFSAPSKNFKRAVDRNLLKRRMREAYRKNKNALLNVIEEQKSECLLMFIYMGKQKVEYREIESKIVVTLQRLIKQTGDK
jgi:ribonuclease P protein component